MRTYHAFRLLRACQEILRLLETDRSFRAFHDGESDVLPEYYRRTIQHELGDYASLLTDDDLRPIRAAAPARAEAR
jgi:hypothetical protein